MFAVSVVDENDDMERNMKISPNGTVAQANTGVTQRNSGNFVNGKETRADFQRLFDKEAQSANRELKVRDLSNRGFNNVPTRNCGPRRTSD